MHKLAQETIDAIKKINSKIKKINDDSSVNLFLELRTCGDDLRVYLLGHLIWASDYDLRDYDDDLKEFEPIYNYLSIATGGLFLSVGKINFD